jgi:hypothetical protein
MNDKQIRSTYTTAAFRLSYPALFEPVAVMGNEAKKKYSATMLFPKKSLVATLTAQKHPAATWMPQDNCAGLYQEVVKIARANFGPDVDLKTLKLTKFRDGDKPKETSGKVDENEKGYIVLRASSDTRPDVLRGDKTRIADAAEVYPGCWVRAVLTVAPFVHKVGGRGVTIYLAGIQKLADDTTFSSRPRAEDEFDAVATGEGAGPASAIGEEKDPWEN